MRGQAFAAAAALALTAVIATPASAQQYPTYHDAHVATQQQCAQSRNNRTLGGAAIGAVAGALLGRELASRGHRDDHALGGAVIGAIGGAAIGRTTAACNRTPQGSYDPYYGQSYQQYPQQQYQQPYQQPYNGRGGEDLYGGPYRESSYGGYSNDCRPGEVITRDPYGREYREQVMMCRGRDGTWRPQY